MSDVPLLFGHRPAAAVAERKDWDAVAAGIGTDCNVFAAVQQL